MKRRNPVAKHAPTFNKGGPHEDKRDQDDLDLEEALDEFEAHECPMCGYYNDGVESFMGHLGRTEQHRCRACGQYFIVR